MKARKHIRRERDALMMVTPVTGGEMVEGLVIFRDGAAAKDLNLSSKLAYLYTTNYPFIIKVLSHVSGEALQPEGLQLFMTFDGHFTNVAIEELNRIHAQWEIALEAERQAGY